MGGKKKKAKNAGAKAKAARGMDKAEARRRARIAEDKTFGLKNKKKSKKVQQFVKLTQQQAMQPTNRAQRRVDEAAARARKAKKDKAKADREMAMLFKVVIKPPKLAEGVDPKSVLCPWFKQNVCLKGKKCAYSHDRNIGRKVKKIDLHADLHETKQADTMDKWDQEKLEKVVAANSTKANKNRQTDIICKHFLDAIERELYGWFWKCPGGKECKYRHALPPGYVFKTRRQRELEKLLEENKDDAQSMEAIIEEQRRRLPATGLTPVTLETFTAWKEKRRIRRAKAQEAKDAAVNAKRAKGRGPGNLLSGRALFTFDPTLFVDDADASADVTDGLGDEADTPDAADATPAGAGAGAGAGAAGAGAGTGAAVVVTTAAVGAPTSAAPPAAPGAAAAMATAGATATPPGGAAAGAVVVPPTVPAVAAAVPAAVVDESLYLGDDDDLDDLDLDDD